MDGLTLQIALRKWCELLDVHAGRDKILRITGYICTLISDLPVILHVQHFIFLSKITLASPLVTGDQRHTSGQENSHSRQVRWLELPNKNSN